TRPFDIQELRLRGRNAIQRASQQKMINPITELPGSQILEERLGQIIYSDESWSLLLLSIVGLGKLREAYGFVAADEMMRASTLMILSAIRQDGKQDELVGPFGPGELGTITATDQVR